MTIRPFATLLVLPILCFALLIARADDDPAAEPKADPEKKESASKPDAADERRNDEGEATIRLLEHEPIRLELKVSEEQKEKIEDLIRTAREDIARVRSKIPSKTERKLAASGVRHHLATVYQNYREKVEEILTPEQTARLQQLTMRIRGMRAIADDEMAAALKLTQEQQDQIASAITDSDAARRELRDAKRGRGKAARQERREKLKELKETLSERIGTILTPEQLEQFEQMQGENIDPESLPAEADVEFGAREDLDATPKSPKKKSTAAKEE